jgi:hypothetical protein
MTRKKITILALQEKKVRGEPISMVTAYDYPSALAADRHGPLLCTATMGIVCAGPCGGAFDGCGKGQAGNGRFWPRGGDGSAVSRKRVGAALACDSQLAGV